jgi:hypothetical protein
MTGGAGANVVALPSGNLANFDTLGPVYSGLKFSTDGNLYKNQPNGGWTSLGPWLLRGTASSFYVGRRIDAGSLSNDAGGTLATPLQLNADRTFNIVQSSSGSTTAEVYFELGTAVDGTVILAERTYSTFKATYVPEP